MCVLCQLSPCFTKCPHVCVWAPCAGTVGTQFAFSLQAHLSHVCTCVAFPAVCVHVSGQIPAPCVCRHVWWGCARTHSHVFQSIVSPHIGAHPFLLSLSPSSELPTQSHRYLKASQSFSMPHPLRSLSAHPLLSAPLPREDQR